jgi:hypothetical protein|tara:strand:+ start:54 stop:173 length:120 start_codon:yes stop_codon:yes gene_type:complete
MVNAAANINAAATILTDIGLQLFIFTLLNMDYDTGVEIN